MATNGTFAHQDQHKVATEASAGAPGSIDATTAPGSSNDLSKDEVGWYFVEQYYTTLSKSPEKLHVSFRDTFALQLYAADLKSSCSTANDPNSSGALKPKWRTFPWEDR